MTLFQILFAVAAVAAIVRNARTAQPASDMPDDDFEF